MLKKANASSYSDMRDDTQTVTVCAGEACQSSNVISCSAATESSSLPNLHFEEQVYTYGFIPEEALERGTMFPELVN